MAVSLDLVYSGTSVLLVFTLLYLEGLVWFPLDAATCL